LKPFEPNGSLARFATNGKAEVRDAAVRSAGVTLFSGAISLAVQTIATMALGRLVSPRDFGLVAIVTTISLLLASFGDTGLPEAIVQREKLIRSLASNLFWINVAVGLLLTIGFAATGPLFAWFYHDYELERVAVSVSPMMLFYSTATVHIALLKRSMRFSEASMVAIYGRTVSAAVSILLAWMGYAHWALVGGAVALPVTQTLAAWYFCQWMPDAPRRVPGTGSALWFAFTTYGRFCLNYFSRNTDNVLVGWRFNTQALGFYKKAYDLFSLSASQFTHSLTLVVVSALNRIERGSAEYRRFLVEALAAMTFLGMGLAAELTLTGKDLIRLLLGPGWEQSGRIFTFFGPGVGIMILYYTNDWIHLSLGKANRWFRWGVVEVLVTVSLFVAGIPWGPVGIAVAWTLSYWLLTLPALWYAGRPIDFGLGPIIGAIWRYFIAALFAGIVTSLVIGRIPWLVAVSGSGGAGLRILITSLLLVVVYLAAVAALYGSATPIYQSAKLMRQMLIKRRSQAMGTAPEPMAAQPGMADTPVSHAGALHHRS
jgi:PST family polysaccharide transporter